MFEFLFCTVGMFVAIPLFILGAVICALGWGFGLIAHTAEAVIGLVIAVALGVVALVVFGLLGVFGGFVGLLLG